MANRKGNGSDFIHGEAYEATKAWATRPIQQVASEIENTHEIPAGWIYGTVVYIYKNKGAQDECGN